MNLIKKVRSLFFALSFLVDVRSANFSLCFSFFFFFGIAGLPAGISISNPKYIGRPETIESVFYMYRLTGDRIWQERGWKMFTSWVEHSLTDAGFASINNVYATTIRQSDSMESFVLAETFKYYYLLVSIQFFSFFFLFFLFPFSSS